ncbi:YceI family protein [Brumimicrobium aurantiacum]|uniref:YceI family protein n=1 Tax=Brumimicrobium aurantiacum TaxID=1737063 RepID=A0A3E1EVH0_9FLAO|nr:YceI family protein [Brumimicrobium aurantiacum]RFC53555.1 YceI family protein [Brumimicrobium aurantiacum]
MKKVIYGIFAFAALSLTSCGGTEEAETETNNTEVNAEETEEVVKAEYQLKKDDSKIAWTGTWVGGENDGKSHHGTISFNTGEVKQNGDDIKGGFTVDMTSISVEDLDETSGKGKLEGHLSNEDFFNTSEYGEAKVELLNIVEDQAEIVLHVAGVEINRTIPLNIDTDEDVMTIKGDFTIDFTKAEMKGMQPNPEKPEEGSVSNEIHFDLEAVLGKV